MWGYTPWAFVTWVPRRLQQMHHNLMDSAESSQNVKKPEFEAKSPGYKPNESLHYNQSYHRNNPLHKTWVDKLRPWLVGTNFSDVFVYFSQPGMSDIMFDSVDGAFSEYRSSLLRKSKHSGYKGMLHLFPARVQRI